MYADDDCVSANGAAFPAQGMVERWQGIAKADYRLCREFALRFGARLPRSLRSQRVGWELFGHPHCALLLPDAHAAGDDDEWHLYYVAGESLFRRSRAERAQVGMLVLAESTEDWADLLRQALRGRVFDVRYTVTPDYVDEGGEACRTAAGFVFALEAHAPHATRTTPLCIAGAGATPEQAARAACRRWLAAPAPDAAGGSQGRSDVTS